MMTAVRSKVVSERPYDAIYDQTYMLSNESNVVQLPLINNKQLYRPNYDELFSGKEQGQTKGKRKGQPTISVKKEQTKSYPEDAIIEGANRYKYAFKLTENVAGQNDNVSSISAVRRGNYSRNADETPYQMNLASVEEAVALYTARKSGRDAVQTRDCGMQTDYRDGEAQTDPYSPPYVVTSEIIPEILALATLTHGKGLPVGLAEIEMIERARAKRRWEASLPPISDPTQLARRLKMMEQQEREEWAFREKQIEKLQQMKFNVTLKMLREKEEYNKENNEAILKDLWTTKSEDKQIKDEKNKRSQERELRKMTSQCAKVEGKLERRDVVQDYSDFGSQVFAPLTRVGQFMDRPANNRVNSIYLDSFEGLNQLEESELKKTGKLVAPQPKIISSGYVKRKDKRLQQLDEIFQDIQDKKKQTETSKKSLKYLQKVEKAQPRPITPTIEIENQKEQDKEEAVIALQSLLRGAAGQQEMLKDAEKRQSLVAEVRSTHFHGEMGKQQMRQQEMLAQQLKQNKEQFEEKEAAVNAVLSEMEGACLSDVADFLSKELVRLEEAQKVQAFALLADRQRTRREAEEAGVRQLEESARAESDEIFKQMVNIHQATIESYLEDIILASSKQVADLEARLAIQKKAEEIDAVARQLEHNRTNSQSEGIVGELVNVFLLPEVERQIAKQKKSEEERCLLETSHDIIYESIKSEIK